MKIYYYSLAGSPIQTVKKEYVDFKKFNLKVIQWSMLAYHCTHLTLSLWMSKWLQQEEGRDHIPCLSLQQREQPTTLSVYEFKGLKLGS